MIEGALLKTKGVQSAEISFEKSEATVQIDPGQISGRQVAAVIEKAGYRAEIIQ